MFSNLGFGEILLIIVAGLVIFGPGKLPEMGRSAGKAIREFKKATQAITDEVTKVTSEEIAESKKATMPKAEPAEKKEPPAKTEPAEQKEPPAKTEPAEQKEPVAKSEVSGQNA